MVGMKSYGRAPTFLLLTGYEQVRSRRRAGRRPGGRAARGAGAARDRRLHRQRPRPPGGGLGTAPLVKARHLITSLRP